MKTPEAKVLCPNCKREIREVTVREEEKDNPKHGTCPHCHREFEIKKAMEFSGEVYVKEVSKSLQTEFDKIFRKR